MDSDSFLYLCIERQSSADLVTFDLINQAAIDNVATGMLTDAMTGLTATFTASTGVLNGTSLNFGVNGPGADEASLLDASEHITVSFNQAVDVTGLTLELFSGDEGALLTFNTFDLPIADTGSGTDVYAFSSNNSIALGQEFRISHTVGNGFSFESLTVETTAIPEPSSLYLLSLCGFAFVGILTARKFRGEAVRISFGVR